MLLKNTKSLCPVCKKIIDAEIYEKNGKVMIRKECSEHGKFEDIYWSDAKLFEKADKYWPVEQKLKNPLYPVVDGCPFDCGLCDEHRTPTILANIDITNRCNLRCPICFANANSAGYVYEITYKQAVAMLRLLMENEPKPYAVQFSGGEPTIHPQFLDMVKYARKLGFVQIQVATNGVKLAEEPDFAQKMLDAGLHTVYLQFDGIDERVYEAARGRKLFEVKKRAIEACRNTKPTPLSTVLVPTIVKGVNDDQIIKIINFAIENIDVVRGINFQPVSFTGRIDEKERERQRFTIPDLIKRIEEDTDGKITREAWYSVSCVLPLFDIANALDRKERAKFTIHPHCGAATYIFVRGNEIIPINKFVDVDGFLEEARKIAEDFKKSRFAKLKLIKAMKLTKYIDEKELPEGMNLKDVIKEILGKRDKKSLAKFHWKSLYIGAMHFQDLYNYDIERVIRCGIHYVTPDGRIIPFCAYNSGPTYREEVEKRFSTPLREKHAKSK
ncbi:MAG: radical SAM protein [Thermoplasmatales archaeon]|nr:radical SAM protein [Thermoplasmatales archaeon]